MKRVTVEALTNKLAKTVIEKRSPDAFHVEMTSDRLRSQYDVVSKACACWETMAQNMFKSYIKHDQIADINLMIQLFCTFYDQTAMRTKI